jgi:para-nitrobenzyl esterase
MATSFPTVSAIFSANKQAQRPLLAGWNKNETSFASVGKIGKFTVQNLNGLAFQKFGLHAGDFLMVYRATNDEEAMRAADDFAADSFVGFGTWSWLEA